MKSYKGVTDGLGRKHKGQDSGPGYVAICNFRQGGCGSNNNINASQCHSCGRSLADKIVQSDYNVKNKESQINKERQLHKQKKQNSQMVSVNGVVHERQRDINQQNVRAITSNSKTKIAKKQKTYISDSFSFMDSSDKEDDNNIGVKSCEYSEHGQHIEDGFHELCG